MNETQPAYQKVLDYVRPPESITGYPHLEELLADPSRLSLIEMDVFRRLPDVVERIRTIPGDMLTAGVWRGGFALALQSLIRRQDSKRTLLLADTFDGFPIYDSRFDKDQRAQERFNPLLQAHFPNPQEVKDHFTHLDLPVHNLTFLVGDVADTLDQINTELALVHLDLDLYEPTLASLQLTYDQLQTGGLVIIDDYGAPVFGCREAVDEFREANGITADLIYLSTYCVYWEKA